MIDRCDDFVTLPDYGPVYCDRPRGHSGDHKAQSLYDSRDIRWKPENVECRTCGGKGTVGYNPCYSCSTRENVETTAHQCHCACHRLHSDRITADCPCSTNPQATTTPENVDSP